jgi:hypothetical protein
MRTLIAATSLFMTFPARRAVAAALMTAAFASSGCGMAFYRGPRGVEGAIERQLDCDLDRQFGLKLGFATAPIASGVLRAVVDEEDDSFVKELHLRHVGVAVFQVENRGSVSGNLDPRKLGLSGWDTLVRIKDDGDQVLLLSRPGRRGGIKEAVLVSYDGDEVVLVRIKGDLDGLIRAATEAARRDRDS